MITIRGLQMVSVLFLRPEPSKVRFGPRMVTMEASEVRKLSKLLNFIRIPVKKLEPSEVRCNRPAGLRRMNPHFPELGDLATQ